MKSVLYPDSTGYFGRFGGRFVPETLMTPLLELEKAYLKILKDSDFWKEYQRILSHYSCRPTPLYEALRFSKRAGGGRVVFKREDLNHTGSHKLNNALGQVLLALRLGKKRIIAETGAGQHGVAAATACALFNFPCFVYMGETDIRRQSLNVYRMELLGAKVISVSSGTFTLKDAINEALRDWVSNVDSTYYVIGSVVGPHPYPLIVRNFQKIIGEETRQACLREYGKLPKSLIACVGGGSNSIGFFYPFLKDKVKLYGVEAEGAASLSLGSPGVLHGSRTYLLQDRDGQVSPAYSIAAGLDYSAVGPEHSWLKESGRVAYVKVQDQDALEAFHHLSEDEGIIPALESAHAVAYAEKIAKQFSQNDLLAVCLSGRGDKDVEQVQKRERRKA